MTLKPLADAWIDENSSTTNKGSDSILKVRSKGPADDFRALVRFGLPATPSGCVVESATLRLHSDSAAAGRTLQAVRVAGDWTESGVTWANQPPVSGAAAQTASGTGYREWTVKEQVDAMLAGGNHGFLIRDANENQDAEQSFHAREKGDRPPQLVVRYTPASGASGAATGALADCFDGCREQSSAPAVGLSAETVGALRGTATTIVVVLGGAGAAWWVLGRASSPLAPRRLAVASA